MGSALKKCLIVSAITGTIAFLFFLPITGIILDGYEYDTQFHVPLYLALAVFVGRYLFEFFSGTRIGSNLIQQFGKRDQANVIVKESATNKNKIIVFGLLLLLAIALPFILNKYYLSVAIQALIYVLLALGLNVVVGFAGLLDLGFVAFYAVGAYSYALGAEYLGLGFWSALPFAALLSACFGAILGFPVLRMHGDYLAIVTLGFGEIIRLVLNNWVAFTGGPNGISAPVPTLFNIEFTRRAQEGGVPIHELFDMTYRESLPYGFKYMFIYFLLLIVVTLTIIFVTRLKNMPIGRAWEALREDEIACRSLGINHVTTKLSAFSMGAMFGGLGGVFFATYSGFVSPSSFTFWESVLILAIVVLGGLGSITGVIISAIIFVVSFELLRDLSSYRLLIYGALMVLMMIWRPQGLLRIARPMFKKAGKAQ